MHHVRNKRSAFTLVEMLVVIGITAILSALLFTVFSLVREKGRSAHCQSNLRQLALAFQQYSSDNGTFPSWYNDYPPTNPLPSDYPGLPWGIRIQPYVKDTAIFQCPTEKTPANSDPMFLDNSSGYSDYSLNFNLSGLADSKVTQPSDVALVFDDFSLPAWATSGGPSTIDSQDRHGRGANYAFVDGHVKWIELYHGQTICIVR